MAKRVSIVPTTCLLPTEIVHERERTDAKLAGLEAAMHGHWALDLERQAALHLLLDQRYRSQTDALAAALNAVDKAMSKAEVTTDKRFDTVNEFRAQLADQATRFMQREEYDTAHRALTDKFDSAQASNSERLREMELRLTSRLDVMSGKGQGFSAGWGYLIGAAGVITAVTAIAIALLR